ncbi:CBS domain-containing protein [Dactylosporangium sp. CA-052675]|uniref:CBS domain-containing protein n=1 Tax=Dactylosporangium sp. CA-052675 TaxID=3239927 RepID=UPI003D8C8CC1
MTSAAEIMTAPAWTIGCDAALDDAVALLERLSVTTVPVVDERQALVGLISDMDLLRERTGGLRAVARGRAPDVARPGACRRVAEVMSGLPRVAGLDTTVAEIAAIMLRQGLRTVPVVAGDRVVGVVSRGDVLATMRPGAADRPA